VAPAVCGRGLPFTLATAAALRFVAEFLFFIKLLLSSGKDKISPAIYTLEYPILESGHGTTPKRERAKRS
jgi:hypothetical protein